VVVAVGHCHYHYLYHESKTSAITTTTTTGNSVVVGVAGVVVVVLVKVVDHHHLYYSKATVTIIITDTIGCKRERTCRSSRNNGRCPWFVAGRYRYHMMAIAPHNHFRYHDHYQRNRSEYSE